MIGLTRVFFDFPDRGLTWVGVAHIEPFKGDRLLVQVGEEIAAMFSLAQTDNGQFSEVIVVCGPQDDPRHLPFFQFVGVDGQVREAA